MSAPGQSDEAPVRRPRRELVEAQIYEQATRLFAERGFAGTSLQDIADAMGMTRPSLYYYVKNKDELLARLVTEITEAPAAATEEIADRDADAPTKLRELVRLIAGQQARHAARFQLVIRSESELPDDLAVAHEAAKRRVLDGFGRIVDQGVRSGEFRPRPVRTTALALIGMCNWVAWWFNPRVRSRPRRSRNRWRRWRSHWSRRLPTARPTPRVLTIRPRPWTCCARTSTTWSAS